MTVEGEESLGPPEMPKGRADRGRIRPAFFFAQISPPEAPAVPQAGRVVISELLGRQRHHRVRA